MATSKKVYEFKNKNLVFTNEICPQTGKLFSNRYFFILHQDKVVEVTSRTNKDEYYSDLVEQLTDLITQDVNIDNFKRIFLMACGRHIQKYGRLIISDMHAKLNVTMHIIDATNGIFHSLIEKPFDGIEIRERMTSMCKAVLKDYMFEPHPYLKGPDGKAKLIPLAD